MSHGEFFCAVGINGKTVLNNCTGVDDALSRPRSTPKDTRPPKNFCLKCVRKRMAMEYLTTF